eukprot:Gregarina_sp_Poly_1__8961@NODE_543_length_7587_cov_73_728590_g430_i0_p2_GENE_NODE_543_length_7587_cov_73_728590_g430_i0NODE_543_length_7587_cov_73_728590_g430_i0_p2_ORF_typecomplete_len558_score53_61ANAPC4_WD40/PF12894_7/2e03ANAPC4_WD40/PF12894_7/9e02ANAPC4_WD40/PF12894_7/0_0081ANAPC4_WD40/PF12894_7/5_3e03ANAPC4_WD40/PF12894_7/21_NODE_543_length_7587_cov_73_728590_g430_i042445917
MKTQNDWQKDEVCKLRRKNLGRITAWEYDESPRFWVGDEFGSVYLLSAATFDVIFAAPHLHHNTAINEIRLLTAGDVGCRGEEIPEGHSSFLETYGNDGRIKRLRITEDCECVVLKSLKFPRFDRIWKSWPDINLIAAAKAADLIIWDSLQHQEIARFQNAGHARWLLDFRLDRQKGILFISNVKISRVVLVFKLHFAQNIKSIIKAESPLNDEMPSWTQRILRFTQHDYPLNDTDSCQCLDSRTLIFGGEEGVLRCLRLENHPVYSCSEIYHCESAVKCLAWLAELQLLLVGGNYSTLHLFRVTHPGRVELLLAERIPSEGRETLNCEDEKILALEVVQNSPLRLVTGLSSGLLVLVELALGVKAAIGRTNSWQLQSCPSCLLSRDNCVLVGYTSGVVERWVVDVQAFQMRPVDKVQPHSRGVLRIRHLGSSDLVGTCGDDESVALLSISPTCGMQVRQAKKLHNSAVRDLVWIAKDTDDALKDGVIYTIGTDEYLVATKVSGGNFQNRRVIESTVASPRCMCPLSKKLCIFGAKGMFMIWEVPDVDHFAISKDPL